MIRQQGNGATALTELRSARLLFAAELMNGTIGEDLTRGSIVGRAVSPSPVASPVRRVADRLRLRAGLATHLTAVAPFVLARQAVLGSGATAPPRLLVRVDEFPRAGTFSGHGASSQAFVRFDELMAAAGVPYLLAVTPRVARDVLDPEAVEDRELVESELEILAALPRERVAFGLHGYNHRTRSRNPRRRSELDGLTPSGLSDRLDRAQALLQPLEIRPRVFIPPYNRFEADQYPQLASRYDVVCGGPETTTVLGLRGGPAWHEDAVYLPSYPPAYGRAGTLRAGVRSLIGGSGGLWIPLVIHWGWEADDEFRDLTRLVDEIAPFVAPWEAFLDEVTWSRNADA
jgi:hypothetical protein